MKKTNEINDLATRWVIRREHPDFTPREEAELEAWLDADPRHRVAFLRAEYAWQRTDIVRIARPLDDRNASDDICELVEPALPAAWTHHARPNLNRRWLAAAAAAAVVVGLTWAGFNFTAGQRFQTVTGGTRTVALEDGSRIQLNTNSEVHVRYTASQRNIVLVRGEAFFDVAHDSERSFHVFAGDTVVRAVGTEFSVRLRENRQVDVLVSEGKVAVGKRNGVHRILDAGSAAIALPSSIDVRSLGLAEVSRRLSWRMGLISLRGETLAEAAEEFNRYNHRRLVVTDESLAGLRMGGTYQAGDPESFIATLTRTFGLRAIYPQGRNNEIHLVRPEQKAD